MSNNPHVTYVQDGLRAWRVFLLGHELGTVIKGGASAYFRTPSGRGRLYPDVLAVEHAINKVAERLRGRLGATVRA